MNLKLSGIVQNIAENKVEILSENKSYFYQTNQNTKILNEQNENIPINEVKKGLSIKAQGKLIGTKNSLVNAEILQLQPSPNILIYTPQDMEEITDNFKLSGIARVFENTFSFRIKNSRTNTIYAESSTVTDTGEMGKYGDFNFNINFSGNAPDLKPGDNLILEVFQYSPKDGEEIDKATVNLKYIGKKI